MGGYHLTNNKTVSFYTFGCKLNFSETSTIGRKFTDIGFEVVSFEQGSDFVVINTCSVTDHADNKTKKIVKDALKNNPLSKVIIVGCYAQLKPEEISKIEGVSLVLGANEKFDIINYLSNLNEDIQTPSYFKQHIKEAKEFNIAYSVGDRTRSFLKIQDGCDYFCSFCTIPLARGRSRSAEVKDIIQSVYEIDNQGIKEIVLTGVNTGDFLSSDGKDFLALIKELDCLDVIDRFRISSIEPNLLNNDIIQFVAQSNKFVPHFHIPLQSGSNKLLSLMRRRYLKQDYESRIHFIKKLMPDACIGVDVIVGFPSETEEDFIETYKFIQSLPISYLHVFTYSERPNTTALRINGIIPNRIRSERNSQLTKLSQIKKEAFYKSQLGKTKTVLWESENHNGYQLGFTENYLRVKGLFNEGKINTFTQVKMLDISPDLQIVTEEELFAN